MNFKFMFATPTDGLRAATMHTVMWLLLALAVAGTSAPARPFSDARLLLDRRLETLRRLLPDGPTMAADQALLRELAQGARLRAFDVRARPPVESGGAGETVFEITAGGRFEEIERFFRQLALSHRLADVDALTLTGTPDAIRLTALVRLPHRPQRAPLPAPPDGARAHLAGAPRPQADAFLRDQALAVAKSETIAAWRRARRNPRLFLSELGAVVRDRPVVLSHAELRSPAGSTASPAPSEHEFVVRGLTLGDGPARALESRFERGFFRLSDFLMARQGGCVRFEARGRSPVVGTEAALPLPSDDPFVQDDTPCRVDRDVESGRALTARAGANGKGAVGGPLTLRLRDVDLADVFFALHTLTGAGFVVDGDVTGRAHVELNRVTLQEALDALQKSAGLRLAPVGAITRVALDRKTALPPVAATGGMPPMSFALKRAEVRDVLAVMSEADASYAALGPPGFLGRASLWLRNAPLPDLRALLLSSAGLGERVDQEGGQRILERGGGTEALVPVSATAAAERRLDLGPHELAVVEFDLAGVGLGADGGVAFAYSPTGTLLAYRPGDPLADGKLREVQSTDALVETDDGPLRLLVPPLK